MKLVREILYEKFTDDDTDPIRDMGIGIITILKQEHAKTGKYTRPEASIYYFGTDNYDKEAFAIYQIIHNIIFTNNFSQENMQKIFNKK
jgi:predicted house-cleaning noncanonical NTP pyrophosphatase (MazG superfamily)